MAILSFHRRLVKTMNEGNGFNLPRKCIRRIGAFEKIKEKNFKVVLEILKEYFCWRMLYFPMGFDMVEYLNVWKE